MAKIDRARLGAFDAFIFGSVLVSQYPGQVIISDFGFYARDFYSSLIRQNRLAIGLNALSELGQKMQQILISDRPDVSAPSRMRRLWQNTPGWRQPP